MPEFVFDIPPRQLAVYFVVAAVLAMVLGILIVKPVLRLLIGSGTDFNQSLNYATSSFSLFYGLLLGLLTVAAYQNNDRIKEGILQETTSLAALYSAAGSYPEPVRSDLQAMMRDYVLFTVEKDWPAHRQGELLNGGFNRVDAIRTELAGFEPQTIGQEVIHAQAVAGFQTFADARQRRLTGVVTQIPNVLWYAVLVGAVINILLIVLLKMKLLQQFVLGTITSVFLAVILFVIVTLDRPLRGEAGLPPAPMELLWERTMVWDEPLI
jgi:hypothetical protein